MARQLRHAYPGAIYHIINRGSRRDKIFRKAGDKEEFLNRLEQVTSKYEGIIFCYCLMDNHYHLLIQTPHANISDIMKNLQGGYANWFRSRYGQVGPLFQSRYKSVVVEDESYLVTLSAYIHLNPVRAKMVGTPEEYEWSSYSQYLNQTSSDLLNPARILHHAGGIDNYAHIIEGLMEDVPLKEAIYGKYGMLGKDSFREKLLRQKKQNIKSSDQRFDVQTNPEFRSLRNFDVDHIKKSVIEVFDVKESSLFERKKNNYPRKIFLYFLKHYTLMKIVEIGELSGMSYSAASVHIRNFEKELKRSREIKKLVKAVEKILLDLKDD